MNLFLIPMWMLSGALFPSAGAPGWLQAVIAVNPVTYGVSALQRALLPAHAAASGAAELAPSFAALVCDITIRTLREGALHDGVNEPWPACPAHPGATSHSMFPEAREDGAWWCCPESGPQVRVGELD